MPCIVMRKLSPSPYLADAGPLGGPDRIGCWACVAEDSAGSGHFGELFFEKGFEGHGLAVPLGEDAGLGERVFHVGRASLSVVGVNKVSLSGLEALAVVAVETGLWFALGPPGEGGQGAESGLRT